MVLGIQERWVGGWRGWDLFKEPWIVRINVWPEIVRACEESGEQKGWSFFLLHEYESGKTGGYECGRIKIGSVMNVWNVVCAVWGLMDGAVSEKNVKWV
jgi:hypothetical protein